VLEDGQRSTEPLLSLKLDGNHRQLHVTRAIHCYAWEGYHAGDNVYLSRETRKWIRELVGTMDLKRFPSLHGLRDEVVCLLFRAVVGSSRLPLTSVEAPLPAFSLGQLAYVYRPDVKEADAGSSPLRTFRDLIVHGLHKDLAWLEKAKLLEIVVRSAAPSEIDEAVELFHTRWSQLGQSSGELVALLQTVFNEIALSPYTDLVQKLLAFLR